MAYSGLELFMDKLKLLINRNHKPLINNHPSILSERPTIRVLYEELSSMIQTLFVDHEKNLHKLEETKNLKKRFKDAAEEAQDIVDLFVFAVNFGNKSLPGRSYNFKSSLSLEDVMTSIKSIKEEFMVMMDIDDMRTDSSQRTDSLETSAAAAGTSCTRNPLLEQTVVGLDYDAMMIVEKLFKDQKELDVISIVGMGGLGKTTLATIVFNDPSVVNHFRLREWVSVSRSYMKRNLLIQILSSIGIELDPVTTTNYEIREMFHKSFLGQRYLIVIDDIWSPAAWYYLKDVFPDHHNGSRILLTSRHKVVSQEDLHGFVPEYHLRNVYQLRNLTDEESWELLCRKVFHGNDCPKSLIKPGMQIAKGCGGLPLAVVVIAGILEKVGESNYSWERVAKNVDSYSGSDSKEFMGTLALSFDYLPGHLRDCFLYLGGFPNDYKFRARSLIWLWVAEGFIREDGIRSLEEIAEDYLTELADMNLVFVQDKKFNDAIKACSIQDLLRELCLEKATKEGFCSKIPWRKFSHPFEVMPCKQRRIFTNGDFYIRNNLNPPAPSIHSLLGFHSQSSMIYRINENFHYYVLLKVLDLQNSQVNHFPPAISLLVHLRYLAIWHPTQNFPSLICDLWSLQTLIVKTSVRSLLLPKTISNMVNLRHLWSNSIICMPSIEKPMNLQTISNVVLGDDVENWVKCFPHIKKLKCIVWSDKENDFESLTSLGTLKITKPPIIETWKLSNSGLHIRTVSSQHKSPTGEPSFRKNNITFPASLKELALLRCRLPWSDMLLIQSLPNLEVLKLMDDAFEGLRWEPGEGQFRQLKFLKLQGLNIKWWDASGVNFPNLRQLVLVRCRHLNEIPVEFGYIPTLELIEVVDPVDSSISLLESVHRIQEEQQAMGNYNLNIKDHLGKQANTPFHPGADSDWDL